MFCSNCGTPCQDGANHCHNCGASLKAAQPAQAPQQPVPEAQPVQPQQTQPQQPTQPTGKPAAQALDMLKKYWSYILLGVSGLAILFGIFSIFGVLKVPVTASSLGRSMTEYGSVSDVTRTLNVFAQLGYILYGLISLVIGGVGILYFLKEKKNMPYYDKYIAKITDKVLPGKGIGFVLGLVGVAAIVLLFLFCLLCRTSYFGASMRAGVNWLLWVVNLFYIGIFVGDLLVINPKKK